MGMLPLVSFVAASILGGSLLGICLAGASLLVSSVKAAQIGLVFAVGAVATVALVRPRVRSWLPGRRCQVPRYHTTGQSLTSVGFKWGLELGVGVCTLIVTPAFLTLVAVGLTQRPAIAIVGLLAVYGLVRGGTIATFAVLKSRVHGDRLPPGVGLERVMRGPLSALSVLAVLQAVT